MATATWAVVSEIDTLMSKFAADVNYGSDEQLEAGVVISNGTKTGLRRSILNFNLGPFPGVADDITAAKLALYVNGVTTPGELVQFERCTKPDGWAEDEATWNDRLTATPWDAGGGDKTEVDRVTTSVPDAFGFMDIPGFLALTKDAIEERDSILSIIAKMDDEADAGDSRRLRFNSRDSTNEPHRPTLTITYTVAEPAQPAAHRDTMPPRNARQPSRPRSPRRAAHGRRARQPRSPR